MDVAEAEGAEQLQHADGRGRRLDAQLFGATQQNQLVPAARHTEGWHRIDITRYIAVVAIVSRSPAVDRMTVSCRY